MTYQLDRETNITPAGRGRWRADVSPHWNIGENPNGGYVAALVLKSLLAEVPHPDPLSVTTHYLRPPRSGDANLEVEAVRAGRRTSNATGRLIQDERPRLLMLATFGDLSTAGDDRELTANPPPDLPPPNECVARASLEQGVHLPILDRVEAVVHPDIAQPGTLDEAEVRGWIRFGDGRPIDSLGLVLLADAFPPSVFTRFGRIGWVPTLELTVHVRRSPAPGWIKAHLVTTDLHNGLLIEDCRMWDENDRLVAQARQLALLNPAPA
ncbi:MAG: thioesterase family protein [Actinomycetia bacterium]|nr:thioesterase family protein [Actinomycetes bacterium]